MKSAVRMCANWICLMFIHSFSLMKKLVFHYPEWNTRIAICSNSSCAESESANKMPPNRRGGRDVVWQLVTVIKKHAGTCPVLLAPGVLRENDLGLHRETWLNKEKWKEEGREEGERRKETGKEKELWRRKATILGEGSGFYVFSSF